MEDLVTLRVAEGVALVTLNRPERMNAINVEAGERFDQAMVEAALDPQVRAIVITGAGDRAFCAGADVERLEALVPGGSQRLTPPGASLAALAEAPPHLRTRYTLPMAVPQPVIAAINGVCAGVGLALATHCDVRFASRTAVFSASFARLGLTAEAGLAKSLAGAIGKAAAADWLLSARKVEAQEAFRLGFLAAVLEPPDLLAHALAYAGAIAREISPRSAAIIKRQLRLADEQGFEETLALAAQETAASLRSEDFQEGLASRREKRPPAFPGR
ncbi:MAG: enoyl-CoA hydratase/isomerase [Phenylobacterium sp.]|nr:enoyl-CoA hydratase/isomerase [Phenylobacterium sp.]